MSAKKETFHVFQSVEGWMVKTGAGGDHSGPYLHREDAIASALVSAKENKPSHVRVNHTLGEWRVECTYDERANAH